MGFAALGSVCYAVMVSLGEVSLVELDVGEGRVQLTLLATC
jgi:amino acid permease